MHGLMAEVRQSMLSVVESKLLEIKNSRACSEYSLAANILHNSCKHNIQVVFKDLPPLPLRPLWSAKKDSQLIFPSFDRIHM